MAWLISLLAAIPLLVLVTVTNSQSGLRVSAVTGTRTSVAVSADLLSIKAALSACSMDDPAGNNGTGFYPSWPASGGAWVAASTLVCPAGNTIWTGYSAPAGWEYRLSATGIEVRFQCNACTQSLASKTGGTLNAGYLTVQVLQ